MPARRSRTTAVIAGAVALAVSLTAAGSATAATRRSEPPAKEPVAEGTGGAVATVDADATAVGIEVLRRGGNAVDAAVATAAALGVTEPYSAGIGGGGFFVYYDAATGEVHTIDGRETAPESMPADAFVDPATGEPYPFFPERVTSGVSVGVPGTLATWEEALERWGSTDLLRALLPAVKLAARGFVVDDTFREQTAQNEERFRAIEPTAELFLPDGELPEVGSTFRNVDLARTYLRIGARGTDYFYEGPIAEEIVEVVQDPPVAPGTTLPVPPGYMELSDLEGYTAPLREPTLVDYRGLQVYGMGPPSSGGSTVGEALNILENFPLDNVGATQALHHYLEASALAFADRNAYVGDPDFVDVPLDELLSDGFAKERSCLIDPDDVLAKPTAPGEPDGAYAQTCAAVDTAEAVDVEGLSTTHLTVADRWGNVVSYTLTIEQTGGSAITVPDRGFILNNELTDFSAVPVEGDPNIVAGGKRPRSSMAPTIVLADGEPLLAVGTPGGSTIITTVLQILLNRLDLGMTLPEAVTAPRASQRNTASVTAEPEFLALPETVALTELGHSFTETSEIGAATGIEFLSGDRLQAVAEPERRGGGSAAVVDPSG